MGTACWNLTKCHAITYYAQLGSCEVRIHNQYYLSSKKLFCYLHKLDDINSKNCFDMLLLKVLYGPVSSMKLWHSSLQKMRRGIDNRVKGGMGMKNQVLVGYWVFKKIQVRVE